MTDLGEKIKKNNQALEEEMNYNPTPTNTNKTTFIQQSFTPSVIDMTSSIRCHQRDVINQHTIPENETK